MGPVLAAFIIGFVWPFIQGIYLSFCKFRLIKDAEFIGFSNYGKAFSDASFRYSFDYTAVFAVVSLVLINVLAFTVAYILTQNIKGSNLFRTVFFMPNLIGGIVLGYIWAMIFDGILSRYSTSILLETKYGFWGLIILMIWQQVGYMMIIYIAGLQAVPDDMIEAASIDGASRSQILFKITIPNVMPSITICTFLGLTNGFKLFDRLGLSCTARFAGAGHYTLFGCSCGSSNYPFTVIMICDIMTVLFGRRELYAVVCVYSVNIMLTYLNIIVCI
jgi:raffinose/stachyose/melibiose transport system permease protein